MGKAKTSASDPFGLRDEFAPRIRLGRYEGASPAPAPYNQILIGRTKVRRELLDWLRKRALPGGAMLITGARGSGKSTFVRTCLDQYEDDPLPRLQRLGPPLSLSHLRFWVLFVYQILLIPIISAQLTVMILSDVPRSLPFWLLATPFVVMALSPLRFSWGTVGVGRPQRLGEGVGERPDHVSLRSRALHAAVWFLARGLSLYPTVRILMTLVPGWEDSFPLLTSVNAFLLFAAVGATAWEWALAARVSALGRRRRLSFLEMLAARHHPLLRVYVNLGFENLEHPAVARSMLTALRSVHAERLLARWSLPSLQRIARILLHILILTRLLSTVTDPLVNYWRQTHETPEQRKEGKTRFARWQAVETQVSLPPVALPLRLLVRTADPPGTHLFITFGDIALFALLLLVRRFIWAPGVGDYHRRLSLKMAATLERLDSSSTLKRGRTIKLDALHNAVSFNANNDLTLESPKLDPRQVEIGLVELLQRITAPRPTRTRMDFFLLALSAEIVFVFDELDKVGSHPRFLDAATSSGEASFHQRSYFSSDRNQKVHRLLSDMKNLLGTAQARFVFIGGRDLDDEWLADRTARNPLLSTIFDDALYVPSIFHLEESHHHLDPNPSDPALLRNIHAFLRINIRSARARSKVMFQRRDKIAWDPPDDLAKRDSDIGDGDEMLIKGWLPYLAVASRGNLKRLQELVVSQTTQRPGEKDQFLSFLYNNRYIHCLHAEIFGHVAPLIEVREEDKVIQSAFYLTEFIFKFHRRAFHWSNLELLEEIVDVHHAPDVREFFAKLVQAWSQSYLVPIDSGMYAYRFDSAVAAEIRYACRISEFSMAAFNFALDETYLLKHEHETRLAAALDRHDEAYYSRTVLGELFDFEDDFERARLHYTAAIRCLDANLKQDFKGRALSVAGVDDKNPDSISRAQIDWIILRLFNKLRLGLTYEKSGDLTDAMLHYTNARTLSEATVKNLFRGDDRWFETSKTLQLLFQPMFACAWIAEKGRAPVSANTLVEKGIEELNELLTENKKSDRGPLVDLHRNAGALYLARGAHHHEAAHRHFSSAVEYSLDAFEHVKLENGGDVRNKVGNSLAASLLSLADVHLANADLESTLTAPAASGLGSLKSRLSQRSPDALRSLTQELPLTPATGVSTYLLLSSTAIRIMRDCGLEERSRWEQLRQFDILAGVVWIGRVHQWIASGRPCCSFPDLDATVLKCIKAYQKCAIRQSRPGVGRDILREAEQRSHRSLDLSAGPILSQTEDEKRLIEDALGEVRAHIKEIPFPAFMVLARARDYVRRSTMEAIYKPSVHVEAAFLDDFVKLSDSYDSAVHFTDFSLGSTLGFWALAKRACSQDGPDVERIARRALTALDKSVGIVTELPEYFIAISKHNYLEDGFNDRSFQSGQAFQSFALKLTRRLRKELLKIVDAKALPREPSRSTPSERREREPDEQRIQVDLAGLRARALWIGRDRGEHCVRVVVPLAAAGGGKLAALEKALREAIIVCGTGEFDKKVEGEEKAALYMYGPDADALFAVIEPVVRRAVIAGGVVIRRYGTPERGAREVTTPVGEIAPDA